MAVVALLAAAGVGERFGSDASGSTKQFSLLAGRSLLWHAARPFVESSRVDEVVVIVRDGDDAAQAKNILADFAASAAGAAQKKCRVAPCGGETRAVSVCNGLAELDGDDWVLVHDAARPCLPADALARLLDADNKDGAALALPLVDALRKAEDGHVCGVVEKRGHYLMQTPQKFLARALRAALAKFPDAADDAEAMWRCGARVKLIDGDARNIKITRPSDMLLAENMLRQQC